MAQMAQIVKAMRSGNPAQVFLQAAGQNPALRPVIQAMNSGAPLKSIVDAELSKQGMTREQAMEQLKQAGLL